MQLVDAKGRTFSAARMERNGDVSVYSFPFESSFVSLKSENFGEGHTFKIVDSRLPEGSRLRAGCLAPAPLKWFGRRANLSSDETSGICVRAYDLYSALGCPRDFIFANVPSDKATGARFGIVAAPRTKIQSALQAMTVASGRPVSRAGGAWALGSEEARGSYMNANVSAANLDAALAMVERGGFDVLHFRESWYSCRGHYPVNKRMWPQGIEDMKAAVGKIHKAGYRAGLHTLTACIDPKDPWVAGPENSQLYAYLTYTLAEDLSADAKELVVTEAPKGQHDVVFTYSGRGNAIRIGNEIVQYTGFTREKPYRYTGLTRGAFGTKAAVHKKGSVAAYLQQRYIAFYPDPDSPLADKVADAIANVYNTCGFDMIYCDGTEGIGTAYGMGVMRDKIVGRCTKDGKPCINEDSTSCVSQSWWYHSRLGAWDSCCWDPKRFHDLHVESMKRSQVREMELLEIQMGWWAPHLAHPGRLYPAHTIDDIEYYASRNAGIDASMSVFSRYFTQKAPPFHFSRMITVLGWYERARRARAFLPDVWKAFDKKGAEFKLRQNPQTGVWEVSPVRAFEFRASSRESSSKRISLEATPGKSALRVTALYAGETLAGSNTVELTKGISAKDLVLKTPNGDMTLKAEESVTDKGARAFRLKAGNRGKTSCGAWVSASAVYSPYRSLGKARALRFRVKGDGSGSLLNVQLETPREYGLALSEHYVKMDFTGWRDMEMLMCERDAGEYTSYKWPYSGYIPVFHRPINAGNVSALNFYLNEVPAGGECMVEISDVVMVSDRILSMENLEIAVNSEKTKIPFGMKSGQFAELEDGFWTLYTENGEILTRRRASAGLPLAGGENIVAYEGTSAEGAWPRAKIEVFAAGKATPAFRPMELLTPNEKSLMRYEAADPQVYAPSIGLDTLAPVAVRPGEKAKVEVTVFGPAAEFDLVAGDRTISIGAIAKGDTGKFVFDGEFAGVCPVAVKPKKADGDFSVRLEFVKRYPY